LAQQINALYRQAVAGFRVEVLPNLEVEDLSGNVIFSNADNAFLSRYTSHMNKVIRTFKRAGNPLDGDTYYLFLIPNPTTDPRQGYMPINGQCGFVFLNNVSPEGVARVAAHELGHGVFRLYHTFSSDNRYILPEGTTDNLMDYNGGTALYKYQWDYIHDPQTMLFAWGEEEEEGAMIGIPDIIKQIREANTRGEKTLKIVQDKCQKWAMKNFKLGNGQKLSYIHLSCSDKLEEPFPFEEGYSGNFDWSSIVNSSALYIDPSEISKVSTIGTKDNKRYVRYQFHELNMPAIAIELPTLTDNVLLHFVVLEEEADKFENYLYARKTSDTIRIYVTRTHTGSNSTTGILRTDDGSITGYTVELPRGSDNDCKTPCEDMNKPYDCYCIMEGIYNFEINTKVYNEKDVKYYSLAITSAVPNGRTSVLLHGGRDDAKGWSQGCILPMPNPPEINSPYASKNRKNTKEQSIDFTKELINWVRMREAEIKKQNKQIDKVVKQIIITKTF
jgi:hypothetical protein